MRHRAFAIAAWGDVLPELAELIAVLNFAPAGDAGASGLATGVRGGSAISAQMRGRAGSLVRAARTSRNRRIEARGTVKIAT